MHEIKSLDKLTSRFDTASEKVSELEDRAIETTQIETHAEIKRTQPVTCGTVSDVYHMYNGVVWAGGKRNGRKNYLK